MGQLEEDFDIAYTATVSMLAAEFYGRVCVGCVGVSVGVGEGRVGGNSVEGLRVID